jgi:hypothetical protein
LLIAGSTYAPWAQAAPAPHPASAGTPNDLCNQPPPPPPTPPPPPSESIDVGLEDVPCTHHAPSSSSNDPNPNTNPDGLLPSDATDTADCGGPVCTVSIQLADAEADITANEVAPSSTDAQFSEASWVRGGPTLYATRDGGGAMPRCPGYQNTFSQWAQFGMRHAGPDYRKTATFTLRHPRSAAAAGTAARKVQICFEAPYPFQNRPGYRVAEHAGVFDGVLPDCAGFHATAALPRPCVSHRGVVRAGHGWVTQIEFRIPAGRQDPKALG